MSVQETLGKVFTKVFKTSSERYVKKTADFIERVNALEPELAALTDEQLLAYGQGLRRELQQVQDEVIGPNLREQLKDLQLMPEDARKPAKAQLTELLCRCGEQVMDRAFAAVREASDRHLGVRNVFDEKLNFDKSQLSAAMQQVFDQAHEQIRQGQDVHQISLPPEFYAQVRALYDPMERPPFRFRHFDVQLIGGRVLFESSIAEMATGEGKTLVATLAVFLVALSGRKVHVITVNDYLAKRDRDWMAPVYEALGLTVGAIQSGMDTVGDVRRAQYACDITYGTNNEFGFDYLRDNMKVNVEDQVQGPLDFAIVDEVDSILIDEARTPLIISGPANDNTERYKKADKIARELMKLQQGYMKIEKQINQNRQLIAGIEGDLSDARKAKDNDKVADLEKKIEQAESKIEELEDQKASAVQYFEVEYDRRSVHLTHEGIGAAQEIAGVGSFYVGSNMEWPHLMEQSLRAHVVFEKEKDYVVQNNEVIIVDEFTGRLMQGRQWSDGLHQAVEAKETVTIKQESQTLATITIQNFFKLYQQLAGMTGTAMTEADEFMKIYNLDVVNIPTNKPIARDDHDDLIYKTTAEKFDAIVEEVCEVSKRGQPVLIGTLSIEKSEALSAALTKRYGLDHEVLNAKQHEREATIVVKAGQQHQRRDGQMWGNITIATNMAGRGTDIKLGPGVREAGGLYVLGTERHEARRIDNQLRGRSGRQGDMGTSQFFLSFEDDLLKLFGGDRMLKLMSMMRWPEGEPMVDKRLTRFIEKTQKKVEQRNFESRKSLLEYDEVMDYQRQVFYTRRQSILEGRGLDTLIWDMVDEVIDDNCRKMLSGDYPYECVAEWARTAIRVDIDLDRIRNAEVDELEEIIRDRAKNNAEQEISVTLGEYMGEDLEESEWNLKGLSKWAMSAYGVNFSQNQLRKMAFLDVQDELVRAAAERIDKTDLSRINGFLGDDYGKQTLCDYVNQKFNLDVQLEELAGKNSADVEAYLRQRARDAYRQREIEYPVDFILNVSLRQQQSGSGFAAKAISDWAKAKFGETISIDEIQAASYDKIRSRLVDLSHAWCNGRLTEELDGAFQRYNAGDEAGRNELISWAQERFKMTLRPGQLESADNPQELVRSQARRFLRQELTELERYVLLQIYDATWKEHLYAMDHLKSSIGLRGFAEKDPRIEYKKEGFRMFQEMLANIRDKVTDIIFKAQLDTTGQMRSVWNVSNAMHAEYERFAAQQAAAQGPQGGPAKVETIKREEPKVGRNDPCPCGSGKKYKKCHGANAQS